MKTTVIAVLVLTAFGSPEKAGAQAAQRGQRPCHAPLTQAQCDALRPLRIEAERLEGEGQHARAAERYQELQRGMAEAGSPRHVIAFYRIGQCLMHLPGHEADAIAAFRSFLDGSSQLAAEDRGIALDRSQAVDLIAELDARIRSSDDMPPEVRARGRRLQEQAMAHVDAQQWALAAELFRQTYELGREHDVPQAPIGLWNMGLALMRIPGREAEARDAFRRFLDESTPLTEDEQIRDWRSTALEHIAELDARIGTSDGETSDASQASPSTRTSISPIGPIVLGSGAAMILAGAITGGVALAEHGSITGMCDAQTMRCPPELQARADSLASLAIASDVLLFGGLAVAATGAALTAILREDGHEAAVSVSCEPTGCAASFEGRF